VQKENFGEYLKKLREERGLTLGQISIATKIRPEILTALETNTHDLLPEIYVTGFLRSIARHLVIEPEQLVDAYQRSSMPPPEAQKAEAAEAEDDGPDWFNAASVVSVMTLVVLLLLLLYFVHDTGAGA
jgi:cytoskeletal protein RodZ